MKILIVGNSHVGALIKAYREDPSLGDFHFLAVEGNSLLPNLQANERCELVAPRKHISDAIADQGLEGVSLNNFDAVVVYGCQLRAAGSGVHWINKIKSPTENYSEQALHASNADFVQDTSHYRFLERMVDWPLNEDVKIISMPSPLPNELAPFCTDMETVKRESVEEIQDFIRQEIERFDIIYLDTPACLLNDDGCCTREAYKATWKNDTAHLNPAGGTEVLKAITECLQCLTGASTDTEGCTESFEPPVLRAASF